MNTIYKGTAELVEIKRSAKKLDPKLHGNSAAFKCATLLLACLRYGASDDNFLRVFTGIRKPVFDVMMGRLRHNGVVNAEGTVCCNWFDKEEGGVAFWMDVNVALGFVERMNGAALPPSLPTKTA